MAQIVVAGVLIIVPLLYTQTLPFMAARLPDIVFAKPVPPPVTVIADAIATTQRSTSRLFVPRTVPKGAPRTTDVEVNVDTIPADVPVITTGAVIFSNDAPPVPRYSPPPSTATEPARTTVATAPLAEITNPVRISGGVLAAKLITQILPKYPSLARQTRQSGTVRLLGIIARDGRVRDLHVLDGPPLLRQAALEAVSQWVYAPTLLGGQPVEVEAPIEVHFQLN